MDFEVNINSIYLVQEASDMAERKSAEATCDPCYRDGKQHKAAGFCVDCEEHLCSSCFNFHKNFKLLQHHVLLDKTSKLQSKTYGKVKDICVDKCPSHVDRVIEYICQSCDKLCCSLCIIKCHRRCETVDFIPDIIKDIEKSKVFLDINKVIENQSVLLAEHERNCKINQYKSKKLRDSAKEDVRMNCQEVQTWLFEKEKEIIRSIETRYNEEQRGFYDVTSKVKTLKDDLEEVKSSVTTKINSCQGSQLFVALQKAKITTNEIQRRLQKLEKVETVQNYRFKEAAYIHDLKCERTFGIIEKVSSDTKKRITFLYSCHPRGRYPGKMCMLSEKILLLRENSLTTLSLDPGKKRTSFLSELHLNSMPADITKILPTEVAVTFPEVGEIKFFDVSTAGHVEEKKTIYVGKGCRSIQYFKKNFIVSFCHNRSGSVSIIEMSGKLKREIVGSSNKMFQIPISLVLNPRNEILYVADSSDGSVTSLTLDGIVINKYTSGDYGLYGISTDKNGSVYAFYVCIGKMIQLSDECSLVKVFENKSYLHVVFSEKNDFMYASSFEGEIIVFEIM